MSIETAEVVLSHPSVVALLQDNKQELASKEMRIKHLESVVHMMERQLQQKDDELVLHKNLIDMLKNMLVVVPSKKEPDYINISPPSKRLTAAVVDQQQQSNSVKKREERPKKTVSFHEEVAVFEIPSRGEEAFF